MMPPIFPPLMIEASSLTAAASTMLAQERARVDAAVTAAATVVAAVQAATDAQAGAVAAAGQSATAATAATDAVAAAQSLIDADVAAAEGARSAAVAAAAQLPRSNLTATRAPLATDDSATGYTVGSRWLWQGMEWVAANVTAGGAIWVRGSKVTPEHFGGRGDGVHNNRPAIQSALNYLKAIGGGELHFPAGRWRVDKSGGMFLADFPLTISGVGGTRSDLYYDDDPAVARLDLWFFSGTHTFILKDMCFSGNLDQHQTEQNASMMFTGGIGSNVHISGCTMRHARSMATAFGGCASFTAIGNTLHDVMRDGLRAPQSRKVVITGNSFTRVADDAVAVHSLDGDSTVTAKDQPLPHQVTISNNTFFMSQGVHTLGGKMVNISGNSFRFSLRTPIRVSAGGTVAEGHTPLVCINITNNMVIDTFGGLGAIDAIAIYSNEPNDGPSDDPNDKWWQRGLSSQPATQTRATAINIRGNTIGNMAPRTGKFSDLGFGLLLDRSVAGAGVGYADSDLDATTFSIIGIHLHKSVRTVAVEQNTFFGGSSGGLGGRSPLRITLPETGRVSVDGISFRGNSIKDWPASAIEVLGTARQDIRMDIVDNDFDLDPYFRYPEHNPDNTWTTISGLDAIRLNSSKVLGELRGNHFRNCSRVWADYSAICFPPQSNFVYADLAGTGLDGPAGNKGVRHISAEIAAVVIWIDGDPTSPTFGNVRDNRLPRLTAKTAPTEGWYAYGHFVKASNFAQDAGGKTILGWVRRSSGNTHTAADWGQLTSG